MDRPCGLKGARMAILPIVCIPDPILRETSTPVETFDAELKTLIADMFETMYDAPGIGLAAVQVGVPKRLLVIDLQEEDDAEGKPIKDPRVFINPEVLEESDSFVPYKEGCLSIPDQYADVLRPDRIKAQVAGRRRAIARGRDRRAIGGLPAARDRPPERRAVHRPSLPPKARDAAQETGQGPQGRHHRDVIRRWPRA